MPLVRPLLEGPLDIVGDVHGEIDALANLLEHLGYDPHGKHPDRRRLVFLGDLTDRGPDSPAVVAWVERLVSSGLAQSVLGNHDFNLLRGEVKQDNLWFFGQETSLDGSGRITPQVLADDAVRRQTIDLFASLPLVLERSDLRVVHACWERTMVEKARQANHVLALYQREAARIEARLAACDAKGEPIEEVERRLAHQNHNPAKVLTSGLERRSSEPQWIGGRVRHEQRVRWWQSYDEPTWCVFGHYGLAPGEPHGAGRAVCIDYSVGRRWRQRLGGEMAEGVQTRLGALRFPEMELVFDDGMRSKLPQGGDSPA